MLITAEIERSADQSLDYTAGFIVVDRNNKVVASNVETQTLSTERRPTRASPCSPAASLLEPGTYLLRFAVADSEGRMGSIERKRRRVADERAPD